MRTPGFRLLAFRWSNGEPFQLLFVSTEDPTAKQCVPGPAFDRWLSALCNIRIIREAPAATEIAPSARVLLEIRDVTSLEPMELHFAMPSPEDATVLMEFGSRRSLVGLDPWTLRELPGGSAFISGP